MVCLLDERPKYSLDQVMVPLQESSSTNCHASKYAKQTVLLSLLLFSLSLIEDSFSHDCKHCVMVVVVCGGCCDEQYFSIKQTL